MKPQLDSTSLHHLVDVAASDIPAAPSPLQPEMLEKFRVANDTSFESVKIPAAPRVCKPSKDTWFRTYADETAWKTYFTYTPEDGMGKIVYLVAPVVAQQIGSVAVRKCLVPCLTSDDQLFFWPLTISDRSNTWAESARLIAGEAMTAWRKIIANMSEKQYERWMPLKPRPDPSWPERGELDRLLAKAFESHVIDSLDHPEATKLLMA